MVEDEVGGEDTFEGLDAVQPFDDLAFGLGFECHDQLALFDAAVNVDAL